MQPITGKLIRFAVCLLADCNQLGAVRVWGWTILPRHNLPLVFGVRFKAPRICSSKCIPRSADFQDGPKENSQVQQEAPVGDVPEI